MYQLDGRAVSHDDLRQSERSTRCADGAEGDDRYGGVGVFFDVGFVALNRYPQALLGPEPSWYSEICIVGALRSCSSVWGEYMRNKRGSNHE
jgi:hypothetical protein